jgi:predicted Zn finger-like uncharacterized protein
MKFTCDKCSAQYMISDEKVGPNGVKVRCKKCGNVVVVRRASPEAAQPAPAPAPAAPRTGEGLDAELGQAFENAFGDTPAPAAAAPAPDLAATQAMSPEEAAKVSGREPAPAATEWYVAIGEAQVGPLPLGEVKRKWEAGDVGPDSLVWRPGMADWSALSTVGDLAAFLAPVPRTSARNAVREEARRVEVEAAPAAASPKRDATWTPGGASALASLANEELSAKPAEPKPVAKTRNGANGAARSLVDTMNLPDEGGVDPTGAFQLPIKGLETTDEKPVVKRSSVARGAEEIRNKRSMSRAIVGGVLATILLVGAGVAVALWYLDRRLDDVAVAAAPAPRPIPVAPPIAPPAAAPAPAQPAPAETAPVAAATEAKPEVAAATPPPQAAAPVAPAPEKPVEAKPAPVEPKPTQVAAAPKRPARTEPTRTTRRETVAPRTVVAAAPPPTTTREPAPAPPRKENLDFGGTDDALVEALGGGGGSGRSVYVPPRPGATSGLSSKLTPAQINEAVAGKVDALRRCVSEQKAREPDATGVIKMRWIIGADGVPRDVKCLTAEYAQSQFAGCIGGVVRATRFPKSATTGQEVTFPFSF